MELLKWGVIFIVSLATLVKSADYFTEGAEKIGLYFGLSSFIVGATIVALGSSLPEIATSIIAVLNDQPSFPIDNIIGSNIANTLMVGGICAMAVGTLTVKQRLLDVDLPFFFLSSAFFVLFIFDGIFTLAEGLFSLLLLLVFIFYTMSDSGGDDDEDEKIESFSFSWIGYIILGVIGIYFGAKYTIESVSELATILDISPSIVTMLAVAIGTSLPELIISVKAALAGKHSIALGNIFGSNTINALMVSGIPVFFGTLTVSGDAMKIGIPFFIVATLGFLFTTLDDRIQKWEGMALLILYMAFVGKITGIM